MGSAAGMSTDFFAKHPPQPPTHPLASAHSPLLLTTDPAPNGVSFLAERRFSCLKWHPDKNADNLEVATEVFQWLQSQRDWYLKE
ncbi:unnamed protein product [Durusdinium trenchii]|uniref:J domain-containing protein n=1 Tax=Durusdinium trenchii TaxID=1381693 RepID=A0ABP0RH43_9DINO